MPALRYLIYTLGVALVTGVLVWLEISAPGSLKLLVYESAEDALGTSEYSIVENLQLLMLLACGAIFARVAATHPRQRPIALLFASIAVAGVIRELDLVLDRYVADNFWQVPVGVIAALTIVYLWREWRRFVVAWMRLWPSPGLTLLSAGALIEFVFAQLFGHEPLWQAIAGDGYQRVVKVSVEELIELAGYALWLIGALEYRLEVRVTGQSTVGLGASP